jgi:hypothetical protein
MVLIKFREAEDAADFSEAFNGKDFNAMQVFGVSFNLHTKIDLP